MAKTNADQDQTQARLTGGAGGQSCPSKKEKKKAKAFRKGLQNLKNPDPTVRASGGMCAGSQRAQLGSWEYMNEELEQSKEQPPPDPYGFDSWVQGSGTKDSLTSYQTQRPSEVSDTHVA
ncbi:hypothetical protein M406DRAFT_71613 [Cryphonectria parasitica EP155]|uniref:Uncharacterized protein n=1 Tax=Cryphonectria parasitica (strain ATCC 38755 / EP155) TaxID=660469 RepID=A0A9P4Y8Y2_CRYP1|nr:uncharacterized protein M406DRAFT_71613 [Cryphonectria parasitica EP155]KAF3768625.1 hypothetical protein M406DRAFT_71613 [Cryphonectria parasitica EP155]